MRRLKIIFRKILLAIVTPAVSQLVRCEEFVDIAADIVFGKYLFIGKRTTLGPRLERIGNYTSIGSDCIIGPNNHPIDGLSTSAVFYSPSWGVVSISSKAQFNKKDTVIESDVWIGSRSIVLGGVTVGIGAVIGAGSVVTKDVPPYAVVAGNPAKVIKYRFSEEKIRSLIASQWWQMEPRNVMKFYEAMETKL